MSKVKTQTNKALVDNAGNKTMTTKPENTAGWRGMDSAPTTNEFILAWNGHEVGIVRRSLKNWTQYVAPMTCYSITQPTHWMPLPPPPKDKP